MVTPRPQRYRDTFQAHYTDSPDIVSYMVSRLKPTEADSIWEPCAGVGDLIDGIIQSSPNSPIRASELDPKASAMLKEKYKGFQNIKVANEDALELGHTPLFESEIQFTRIIANPPYGAYQSHEKKTALKKQYPGLYVRDTYGVIFYHCFRLLDQEGRLVFIIPDTFLWLHRHDFLRRTLLNESTIEEIVLFPSKFFPGISFGYSGLCIISLIKRPAHKTHQIRIINNLTTANVLMELALGYEPKDRCLITNIRQKDILSRLCAEFAKPSQNNGITLSSRANLTLSDMADVRTGFYSGNDRHWVRRANADIPRSKSFDDVGVDKISDLTAPPLYGINGPNCFIPLLRGGAARFVKQTQWYVNWSRYAVSEYRRPGENPARFQNSQYYFSEGIGVPMVASARLTATLLEGRLFDQSIVGIFPKNEQLLMYLLGFLNTELATKLLRQINPTANNSANYLKRMPIVNPTHSELKQCNNSVSKAIKESQKCGDVSKTTLNEIEDVYRRIWCKSESCQT